MRYAKDFPLHGHSDASHTDYPKNSSSVSGYLYIFAGGRVTWNSKKQRAVTFSSCESEYIALAYASQDAVCLSDLLSKLTFPQLFQCRCARTTWDIKYYSIRVKDRTHSYNIPFSARADCIEQDNRISCQDS